MPGNFNLWHAESKTDNWEILFIIPTIYQQLIFDNLNYKYCPFMRKTKVVAKLKTGGYGISIIPGLEIKNAF